MVLLFIFVSGVLKKDNIKADEQLIRIGYVPSENFINDSEGEYTGYCVDYLSQIAMYTGWKYQYVSGTWEECLDRVESGEVDFVCMVQETEDREQRFIFSKLSMGDEYGLLYARNDEDIYYRDYENMNGCTVAMMPGTVYDARLDNLEMKKM